MMNQDYFDWAALAQQWIQKNSSIPNNNSSDIPEPPPPPIISANVAQHLSKKYEEQGEADMEVEEQEADTKQQQPNFFHSASQVVQPQVWFGPQHNQQIPYCNSWNQWQTAGNVSLPAPQLHIPPVAQINLIRDQVLPIPPLIKTDNSVPQIEETTTVIDAAKRKTLPAWIREGLEKMEREKLKQMEKLKSTSDNISIKTKSQWSDDDEDDYNNKNENYINNTKLNDDNDESTVGSKPIKSSFDLKNIVKSSPAISDSENSADDDIQSKNVQEQLINKSSPELLFKKSTKSYDEIMEELMLVVRRSLTEILLEVTTEEILNISQETYKKYKLKASSAQVFRKSALSSITGKLGLGAYADSASSDEVTDSSDDENGKNSDQEKDSEDELRENIRNCQKAFKIIAQEIDTLTSQEENRKEKIKEKRLTEKSYSSTKGLYSGSGNSSAGVSNNNVTLSSAVTKKYGANKEFGETQHTDKKSLSNGKRPKERTSRFSDNKDSRHKSAPSSSHYLVPTATSIPTAPPAPPFLITNQSKGSSTSTQNIKEYDEKSSSTSKKHRSSSSSSNESKSSSRRNSYRHRHRYDLEQSSETSRHKKSSRKDDKYSSSSKKDDSSSNSSRRKRRRHNYECNSSDSDDYHHRHRKNSSNSEIKSRRNRSRSRSKSRTTSIRSRSRSRSRSSYSSRRHDRY